MSPQSVTLTSLVAYCFLAFIRYASLALRNASRDECMSSSGISSMSLGK